MATCNHVREKVRNGMRLAGLAQRLLRRQRELLSKMGALEQLSNEFGLFPAADAADQAVESTNNEMTFRITEMRSGKVLQIEEALQKILDGTYGVCEWCGKRISAARLECVPEAALCVPCQEEFEREHPMDDASGEWAGVSEAAFDNAPGIHFAQNYVTQKF